MGERQFKEFLNRYHAGAKAMTKEEKDERFLAQCKKARQRGPLTETECFAAQNSATMFKPIGGIDEIGAFEKANISSKVLSTFFKRIKNWILLV